MTNTTSRNLGRAARELLFPEIFTADHWTTRYTDEQLSRYTVEELAMYEPWYLGLEDYPANQLF